MQVDQVRALDGPVPTHPGHARTVRRPATSIPTLHPITWDRPAGHTQAKPGKDNR
jgi:hypothetical protein